MSPRNRTCSHTMSLHHKQFSSGLANWLRASLFLMALSWCKRGTTPTGCPRGKSSGCASEKTPGCFSLACRAMPHPTWTGFLLVVGSAVPIDTARMLHAGMSQGWGPKCHHSRTVSLVSLLVEFSSLLEEDVAAMQSASRAVLAAAEACKVCANCCYKS